jgi:SAM-dependent methyltransferase
VLPRAAAALLQATTLVDRAYRAFSGVRSALVASLAPDSVLDAYNERAYGNAGVYRPGSANFREALFRWEEGVIERHFPPAPARVLVGGAGGGREPLALAARGYEVVAFDPAARLVDALGARAAGMWNLTALAGRYEDLPRLRSSENGARVNLQDMRPFDAAILGWASYSHLRTAASRRTALERVAAVTTGAILLSFYLCPPPPPPSGVRAWLAGRHLWSPTDRFTPAVGFYHLSTKDELLGELAAAGLEVVEFSADDLDGRWPYCVARRIVGG